MEKAIERYAEDHDYENWLLRDLVELCKQRGLKCTRTKEEIIERLVRDDTKFLKRVKEYMEEYGTNFCERNKSQWSRKVKLEGLTICQLKEHCKNRDINVSGDKMKLCSSIHEYDEKTLERMAIFCNKYIS